MYAALLTIAAKWGEVTKWSDEWRTATAKRGCSGSVDGCWFEFFGINCSRREQHFHQVRVGEVSLCSQLLLLPLGIRPLGGTHGPAIAKDNPIIRSEVLDEEAGGQSHLDMRGEERGPRCNLRDARGLCGKAGKLCGTEHGARGRRCEGRLMSALICCMQWFPCWDRCLGERGTSPNCPTKSQQREVQVQVQPLSSHFQILLFDPVHSLQSSCVPNKCPLDTPKGRATRYP